MACKAIAKKAALFEFSSQEKSKLRRKPAMKRKKRPLHPMRTPGQDADSESDAWNGYKSDSDLYSPQKGFSTLSISSCTSPVASDHHEVLSPWNKCKSSDKKTKSPQPVLTLTYSSSQSVLNRDAYCACEDEEYYDSIKRSDPAGNDPDSDSNDSSASSSKSCGHIAVTRPIKPRDAKITYSSLPQPSSAKSVQQTCRHKNRSAKFQPIYAITSKKLAKPESGITLFFFNNEFLPETTKSLGDLTLPRVREEEYGIYDGSAIYADAMNCYSNDDDDEPLYEEVGEVEKIPCFCESPVSGINLGGSVLTPPVPLSANSSSFRPEEREDSTQTFCECVHATQPKSLTTSTSLTELSNIKQQLQIILGTRTVREQYQQSPPPIQHTTPPHMPNQVPLPLRNCKQNADKEWDKRIFQPRDDDTTIIADGSGSGCSTYSSGKHGDNESVYAEPIYNHSSGSGGSLYGTKSVSSPPGGQKPWSPAMSSSSASFLEDSNYNDSIWSCDQSSSAYSSYGPPSSGNFRDVRSAATGRPVPTFNGDKTLPPLPPGQSPFAGVLKPGELPTKFSSIAKTAGRKLAKKLFSMRRTSRSGLEDSERRVSSPEVGGSSNYRGSLGDIRQNPSGQISPARRCISRPNIPPPQPPTPPTPPLPGNGPPKVPLPPLPIASQTVSINNMRSTTGNSRSGSEKSATNKSDLNPTKDIATHKLLYSNSNYYSPQGKKGHDLGPQSMSTPEADCDDFDDDYEDSDFYDSDSELIRNFVSAVQPIYSMEEEPLYQYYTYGISLKPEDDYQPVVPKNLGLTLDMLVPRVGQRTLWCELPEVMSSGILAILSDKQKQLQEAIFEILTSEVSYLKSLDVLINLFYESNELNAILNDEEAKFIYGNITEVKECCQSFLAVLLKKWEESWYIQEIGEVINEYTLSRFIVYKEYCRNKPHQDRTLQRLRITNEEFVSVVKTIEENPKCQMLRMDSFLMLPMQRITRLPLLVNAVIQRTTSLKEKAVCEEALKNLTNLVIDCNEAARESQDAEETAAILDKIDFPRGTRPPTLGQFILKGDFIKNPFDNGGKNGSNGNQINWTFRKNKRTFYWLILFTNYLVIAKKKGSGKFEVLDMVPTKDSVIKPLPNIEGGSKDFQHFFMLHFAMKDSVYFLGARTQSEIERWKKKLESLRPAMKSPQPFEVLAIFPYKAQREDELSFQPGDKILVTQTQPDGWYFGEKLEMYDKTANETGWFPGNYCES